MATPNNQISINLSGIQDPYVRDALNSVVRFVNELSAAGIKTSGPVSCREISVKDENAVLDSSGNLKVKTIETDNMGSLKIAVRRGTIAKSATLNFKIPGTVLGATGWARAYNSDQNALYWQQMPLGPVTNKVFISDTYTNVHDTVRVINLDSAHSHPFKLVIFYAD